MPPTDTDRGVSESLGVAVLVLITVTAVLSVGLSALFVVNQEETNQFGAEIRFQYLSNLKQLLIFYDSGDDLDGDRLFIEGENNVTWAELRGEGFNGTVQAGHSEPLRVGSESAYGNRVTQQSIIKVVYDPEDGEKIVLGTWKGDQASDESEGGNEGPGGPDGGGPGDGGPGNDGPGASEPGS